MILDVSTMCIFDNVHYFEAKSNSCNLHDVKCNIFIKILMYSKIISLISQTTHSNKANSCDTSSSIPSNIENGISNTVTEFISATTLDVREILGIDWNKSPNFFYYP